MALIIGGHPRSGTTLLQEIMSQHPDISVTNEFGCFAYTGRSYMKHSYKMIRRCQKVSQKWAFNPARTNERDIGLHNLQFTMHYLLRLSKQGPIEVAKIEETLKRAFPQSSIVGDKWPHYIYLIDKYVELDNVCCLVIYRDCRDVTSSFLKQVRTTWRSEAWVNKLNTAEMVAGHWVQVIGLMEHHADHLHIVRYEDLIAHPRHVFSSIGDWLGVDPAGFPLDEIKDTSVGKYQNGLTDEELAAVMAVAGPTLARLGYIQAGAN